MTSATIAVIMFAGFVRTMNVDQHRDFVGEREQ